MKIARIDSAPFRLPLRQPFRAGKVAVTERRGFVVRFQGDDGQLGYGEVAPLPGLHRSTLKGSQEILLHVARALEDLESASDLTAFRDVLLRSMPPVPAALWFGLETAWLGLRANQTGVHPARLLSRQAHERVPLNALFDGDLPAAEVALAQGAFEPYASVKVKVGKRPLPEERRLLELLIASLPEAQGLRIDANRRFSLAQALELFDGLPPERVEYLEEPLETGRSLKELTEATGLALALDESLFFPDPTRFREEPVIAAWILKPARMGGYLETLAYAERARDKGKVCVISSCLESGLGLWAQAQLAAVVNEEPVAAGLATDVLLEGDIVDPPYDSRAGSLRTADWRGAPSEAFLREAGWLEEVHPDVS